MAKQGTDKKPTQRLATGQQSTSVAHSKTATINDIARLAGVSKKTVSRVINDLPLVKPETRLRVDQAMKKMDYKPNPLARGLAARKSFLIGLVYDNPNAEFVMNFLEGALEALRDSGFELIVHPCNRRSTEFLPGIRNFIQRQKLHGVIVLPPISENPAVLKILTELNCPNVSISSVTIAAATHRVISNDRDACAAAAEYLAQLGHQRIALIAGPDGHRSANERLHGFREGLQRNGLTIPPEFIASGGYTFESGTRAAEILLSLSPRPTAIFASNDEMAAGVYQVAHRLGVAIPEELSVMGFDDSPIASRIWPPLTTIRMPIRLMSKLAAMQIVTATSGSETQDTALVEAQLIMRGSIKPPNAS